MALPTEILVPAAEAALMVVTVSISAAKAVFGGARYTYLHHEGKALEDAEKSLGQRRDRPLRG